MARKFGADPEVAGQVARELGRIRTEMTSMGRTIDGYDEATGSRPVQDALRDFFDDSSDSREQMDGLLERASGLLRGLAEGTTSVDRNLAGALDPDRPGSAGR